MKTDSRSRHAARPACRLAAAAALLLIAGCLEGDDGARGPRGAPGPSGGGGTGSTLGRYDDLPGLVIEILALNGGSGPDGGFRVGDRPSVRFRVTDGDGDPIALSDLNAGRILVAGPSFHYQLTIPRQDNLITASVANADGSYTYRFTQGFPDVYPAQYNDSANLGLDEGDLKGQPLLAGTYTLAIEAYRNYTIEQETFRDPANATVDLLFGGATVLEPREVVKNENCNNCHASLRAHGGSRVDVKYCVTCHTAGAEDRNTSSVAGGTPGVTIDFKVMIHKLHNAAHLPSVNGVATNPDGTRNYAATARPYQMIGYGNRLIDFSDVAFPMWPNMNIAMPRDQGYSALGSAQKALEDTIRTGATSCAACHGDPDGAGPAAAPAQGDFAYQVPSRMACGSCHDDIDWSLPYTANGQTMPAQSSNAACVLCHPAAGTALAVADGHLHPLLDPDFNPGTVIAVTGVSEAGVNDGDGTLDPGEKVEVSFRLTDGTGAAVAVSALSALDVTLAGPITNRNLVLNSSIPRDAIAGTGPDYTILLPQPVLLEFCGTAANDLVVESFPTARAPHWATAAAPTSVFERTATAGLGTTLLAAAAAGQNYVDVADPGLFARDDYVVLDDGLPGMEYRQIALVDGNRLWFKTPYSSGFLSELRYPHAAGSGLIAVTLSARVLNTHYTLNAAAGTITEVNPDSFLAGDDILVNYWSDFVMPGVYATTLNDGPGFDETWGDWTAKPLASGTYSVGLWGARNLTLSLYGETNSYRSTAPTSVLNVLVGDAAVLDEYELISGGGSTCYACHGDLYFHGGGRRGFESCILCHGLAGGEDRARYVAGNAPETPDTTIDFRNMLHKIHMGKELARGDEYVVVGFGSAAWPNNFTNHMYDEVGFPAMPSGVKNCAMCHGAGNTAWQLPSDRNHPTSQTLPAREWRAACNSCHDSLDATAHIDLNTSGAGVESCEVCHGAGKEWAVPISHKVR